MPSRHGLQIRAAEAADAPGLAALMRSAGMAADAAAMAVRIEAIRTEHGAVLLADERGPPSGVIAVHWAWTLQSGARVAHVTALAVAPEARRRGVARLLVKAASQAARAAGSGELRLTLPPEADEARHFAVATGFSPVGDALSRPLRKRG